jgi:hypothetical protein
VETGGSKVAHVKLREVSDIDDVLLGEMVREIGFDGLVIVEPFNADVRALPPPERVAAVAAPLAAVWPG